MGKDEETRKKIPLAMIFLIVGVIAVFFVLLIVGAGDRNHVMVGVCEIQHSNAMQTNLRESVTNLKVAIQNCDSAKGRFDSARKKIKGKEVLTDEDKEVLKKIEEDISLVESDKTKLEKLLKDASELFAEISVRWGK